MTALLLIVALAGFVAIGFGVSLLRANARPALSGSWPAIVRQWTGTLAGQRAVGAALIAAGTLVVLLVLALRP